MEQKIEAVSGTGEIAHTSTEKKDGQGPLDENAHTSSRPPPQGFKYRVEYRNSRTGKVVHLVDTDGLDFEAIDNGEIPFVFEIVTTLLTLDEEFQVSKDAKEQDIRTAPRVSDNRKRIAMHIRSPAIIHALRSVVKYYPGQSLLGDTIIIPEPYLILVHHEKELKEYRERCHPSGQTNPVCPKERSAYYEIKILQDFLEQTVMPAVRLERERNGKGLQTFDMLWLRMKPGTTAKNQHYGSKFSYGNVLEYVKGGGGWAQAWEIGYWTLDYNGTYLGTCKGIATIDRFEGERKIDDLYVLEDSAFEESIDESVKALVEQGEKFHQLLTKKCQYYKGTTFNFPLSSGEFDSFNLPHFLLAIN